MNVVSCHTVPRGCWLIEEDVEEGGEPLALCLPPGPPAPIWPPCGPLSGPPVSQSGPVSATPSGWDGGTTHPQLGCSFQCLFQSHLVWVQSHLACSPPCENNIFHLSWKNSQNSHEATPFTSIRYLYESPNTTPCFVELVLDNMMASKQLEAEHRERVQEVLLSRHRHQHEKEKKGIPIIRSLADIGKKHSSKTLEDKGELWIELRV